FITMMMPDVFGAEDSRKTKKAARTVAPSNGVVIKTPTSRPSASRPAVSSRPTAVAPVEAAAPSAPRPMSRPSIAPAPIAPPIDIEAEERAILDEPSLFGVKPAREKRVFDSKREFSPKKEFAPKKSFAKKPFPPKREFKTRSEEHPPQKRAAAPMNLGKPPKHLPGPARANRLGGETPELNRRARRAAKFGNPL
ncbi:MAG TPA: hypothetical protein VM432_11260, partial [Bdellovibrionales bacterium]|nr:hypothetical protein [Bdellovibrionales bacterium]